MFPNWKHSDIFVKNPTDGFTTNLRITREHASTNV